jgi:uroporphyrinogen-III synthase
MGQPELTGGLQQAGGMHVLITRPEPDASLWLDHLRSRGIAATIDPMLDIVLAAPSAVLGEGVRVTSAPAALVITSRNAVRWLATATDLGDVLHLPIFTVGPGSGAAVRALGFTTVHEGAATARDLVPVISAAFAGMGHITGRLLHLSGDKIAFDLAPVLASQGLNVDRRVVYSSQPAAALAPATVARLASGVIDSVVLLSPLTAETFVDLVSKSGLSQFHQRLVYICLSQNIARCLASLAPKDVVVADEPNAQAVLMAIEVLAAAHPAC